MNRKDGLHIFLGVGLMISLLGAWYCYLAQPYPAWTYSWFAAVLGFVGLIFWINVRKSPAPEVLHELGLKFFEQDGFCFSLVPNLDQGRCFMTILYQNRYSMPCDAEVLLRPAYEESAFWLKRLRIRVHCEGGHFGKQVVPFEIPSVMAGKLIRFQVGADADYPQGFGKLVRYKDGIPVPSIMSIGEDREEIGEVWDSEEALVEWMVPSELSPCPNLASDVDDKEIVDDDEAKGVSANESVHDGFPAEQIRPSHSIPHEQPDLPSDDTVYRLLESLDQDIGLKRHGALVKSLLRTEYWKPVGLISLIVFFSVGAIVFCFYRIMDGDVGSILRWTSVALIPVILAVVGGFTLFGELLKLFTPYETEACDQLLSVCSEFYNDALGFSSSSPKEFISLSRYFPPDVVQEVFEKGEASDSVINHWRVVQEKLMPEVGLIAELEVLQSPRENPKIIDLVIIPKGSAFGEAWFRNVALQSQGKWFLATAEPIWVRHKTTFTPRRLSKAVVERQ